MKYIYSSCYKDSFYIYIQYLCMSPKEMKI